MNGAFNNDRFICNTFINLKNAFNIDTIVETGTYHGDTTVYLAQNFKNVYSIEVQKENYDISLNKLKSQNLQAKLFLGKSEEILKNVIIENNISSNSIFYLDAHWYECPLQKELEIIADCKIKPIIAIHDFVVPDSQTLGFDSYNDQPFTFEWLKYNFDKIYNCKYYYWYNNDFFSEGAKRGIIYLAPNNYGM